MTMIKATPSGPVEMTPQEEQEWLDSIFDPEKDNLIRRVYEKFISELYKDFSTIDSNSVAATIQFRNQEDRANIESVAIEALLFSSDPEKIIKFRNKENTDSEFTPSDFLVMASDLKRLKRLVMETYWTKKAEIRSLTSHDEIQSYDIDSGWPA